MMYLYRLLRYMLTRGCVVLLLSSAAAQAQDELDVTMRMVTDDESLGSSFVQQLELPEPLEPLDFGTELPGQELANEAMESGRETQETLAEQSRETRDALETELPGESIGSPPELDLPGIDEPDLGLPPLEVPDLPLVDEDALLDGNLLDDPLVDGQL